MERVVSCGAESCSRIRLSRVLLQLIDVIPLFHRPWHRDLRSEFRSFNHEQFDEAWIKAHFVG
jgi:hypothetical protein